MLHQVYKPVFSLNVPWTAEIVFPSCKHPFSIYRNVLPGKAKGIEISSLQCLFYRAAIPLWKELGCSCEPAVKSSCLRKKQAIYTICHWAIFVSAICTRLHRAECPMHCAHLTIKLHRLFFFSPLAIWYFYPAYNFAFNIPRVNWIVNVTMHLQIQC